MQNHHACKQKGFTLVEIMVGLVIGLLVTLVVVNVFRVFEAQKRSTTGNSDAQTNGAIALFNIQRDVEVAGYGLPVYSSDFSPFNCPVNTTVDHDNVATSAQIGLSPVVITDGTSDTISIHYGDSMKGGISVEMLAGSSTNVVQVDNNVGCAVNDIALAISQSGAALDCSMTKVTAVTASGATPVKITLASTTNVNANNSLACLGVWNEIQYAVASNQLTRTGAVSAGVPSVAAVPIVPDIVNIQAQYGVSATANSNQVTEWANATGDWENTATKPTLANRNRIKAIRIAIVARNGLLETNNVTTQCTTSKGTANFGPCAWDDSGVPNAAPLIDLRADGNWQRYRYRVYESIFPVRNIIWSRSVL